METSAERKLPVMNFLCCFDQSDQGGFTPASVPSATAITRKLPSEILPGFSLKSRSGTNATSSVGQVPSTFFVYVEKLDVEVDIFDGKSLSLIVEYVGGDTDVQEPVDIDELDDDFDWAAEAIKDVENPLDVIFKGMFDYDNNQNIIPFNNDISLVYYTALTSVFKYFSLRRRQSKPS